MAKQNGEKVASAPHGALERVLQQIEASSSHYEALGVRPSATESQITAAYQQVTRMLLPSRAALEAKSDAPVEALERLEQAASRVAQAHAVLSNARKRLTYDRFVSSPTGPPANPSRSTAESNDVTQPGEAKTANRRRCQRFPLTMTTLVVGYDRKNGRWEERVESADASRTGITLKLRHRIRHGSVVHLTLPLPARLRNHGADAPDYKVYALVRRVQQANPGVRLTAVEFVGEHPPAGYLDKPWATFQTRPWAGVERRRAPREERGEPVWVEYYTEALHCLRQEAGRTEDVSAGGLRILVKSAPPEFEFVRINYPERGIESYAIVCNRFIKRDGLERLCVQFINNQELAGRAVTWPAVDEAVEGPERQAAPAHGKRILVADDDLPLRRVLGKILTSAGYDVVLVEDGKAAIEKAAEIKPDLVITDALMPKMHGFLVCKALKEMQPAPKVIMLTAVYTKLNYRFEARDRYGADDLLTKPFEVANLLKCIERHLNPLPRALAG